MANINPYLHFDGDTEAAFNFYKSIFGGEFAAVMRFGEAPGCDGMPIGEADKDKIMHIALPIGRGDILMGGDVLKGIDAPESTGQKPAGNNFSISVGADSRDAADKIFSGLAAGGKVEMPLADAFWGDYFGMLEDRFGVQWMVNYNEKYVQK